MPPDDAGESLMAEESSFEELMRRVRAGDDRAAEELVRRYEPTIRRVVRVRLADAHLQRLFDSMDVCQSVFGSFFVHAALGDYDLATPEEVLGLLISMGKKKVIDQARWAGAARRDFRRVQGGTTRPQLLASTAPSPSQEVAGQELLQEFRRRLSADELCLADQRAAGLGWDEIAAGQGGSPEALRKQLARAIQRVSQELGLEEDT
jgi:RNA polymerase sigma-70 factor (ECF subfamily)